MAKVVIPTVLDQPVDEKNFIFNVRKIFKDYNVHVSSELPDVLGLLCRTLNYSITNPKNSNIDLRNIWAFPAQTGIGKSIALQIYVALLKTEASLIVVSTREEANHYAEMIGSLNGDLYCATAAFSGGYSKEYAYSTEAYDDIDTNRCLVITHKRMQDIANADEETQDLFRLYRTKDGETRPRELVVIDEKLSFANHESMTFKDCDRLLDFVENALVYSKACRKLGKRSQGLKQLRKIKNYLVAEAENLDNKSPAKLVQPEYMLEVLLENNLPEIIDLEIFDEVVGTRFDEISNEINAIMKTEVHRLSSERSKTLTLVRKFRRILQRQNGDDEYCNLKPLALFKTNQDVTISKFKQFYSAFGSCVVLDATATVNEYYQAASKGRLPCFDVIDVPKIRKYQNLKIFTAKGFSQTRYALSDTQKKVDISLDVYEPVIEQLIEEDEKLLVIGHKTFINEMQRRFHENESVDFTYWGNHVGKNDWNDCSKVLVIGWNTLPPIETVSEIYGGHMPSGELTAISKITKENLEKFSNAQLAQDIIQAVMRTRARIIADDDSDCLPAEVYLLYGTSASDQAVVDRVVDEFPLATTSCWIPNIGIDQTSFSKPEKNAHNILLALDQFKQQGLTEISMTDVREKVNFSRSTFSKAMAENYFVEHQKARGIQVADINRRQKKFVF